MVGLTLVTRNVSCIAFQFILCIIPATRHHFSKVKGKAFGEGPREQDFLNWVSCPCSSESEIRLNLYCSNSIKVGDTLQCLPENEEQLLDKDEGTL